LDQKRAQKVVCQGDVPLLAVSKASHKLAKYWFGFNSWMQEKVFQSLIQIYYFSKYFICKQQRGLLMIDEQYLLVILEK
jgi:hypothetical protein